MSTLLTDAWSALRRERLAFGVLGYAALALVLDASLPHPAWFSRLLPPGGAPLAPFIWWVGELALFWVAIPIAIARLFGLVPRALGLGAGRLQEMLFVFAALYGLALVGVLVAASQPRFLETYPMIAREPEFWTWRMFLAYSLLYGAQFVCVEFFFRGFLLFSLRPRFGTAAIAIMIVPYAMLHLGKPIPEILFAIPGGAVLGWLALRGDTIWGGVLVHIAMALTMDAVALSAAGEWPARW